MVTLRDRARGALAQTAIFRDHLQVANEIPDEFHGREKTWHKKSFVLGGCQGALGDQTGRKIFWFFLIWPFTSVP